MGGAIGSVGVLGIGKFTFFSGVTYTFCSGVVITLCSWAGFFKADLTSSNGLRGIFVVVSAKGMRGSMRGHVVTDSGWTSKGISFN